MLTCRRNIATGFRASRPMWGHRISQFPRVPSGMQDTFRLVLIRAAILKKRRSESTIAQALMASESLPLAESIRNLQRNTGAAFGQIELASWNSDRWSSRARANHWAYRAGDVRRMRRRKRDRPERTGWQVAARGRHSKPARAGGLLKCLAHGRVIEKPANPVAVMPRAFASQSVTWRATLLPEFAL